MPHDRPSTEKALNRPEPRGIMTDNLDMGRVELEHGRALVAGIGASAEDTQLTASSPRLLYRSACARLPKVTTAARTDP